MPLKPGDKIAFEGTFSGAFDMLLYGTPTGTANRNVLFRLSLSSSKGYVARSDSLTPAGKEATAGGQPLQLGVTFSIVIQRSSTGFEVTIDGLRTPEFDFTQRIPGDVTAVGLQSVGPSFAVSLRLYSTVALKPTPALTNAASPTVPTVSATWTPATPRPRLLSRQLPAFATATDPRPRTEADDSANITLPPDAQVGTIRQNAPPPRSKVGGG